MSAGRPNIPAALKRRVLVEAGHRCAIPTCRAAQVEIAHIVAWSKVKEHAYGNLIVLCPNCHTRFDNGEIDVSSIKQYKAQLRYLTDRYSLFELDVLEILAGRTSEGGIPFLSYLVLLIKRILEEGLVEIKEMNAGMKIGNIKTTPDILSITPKGRRFMTDFQAGRDIGYEYIKD